MMRPAIGVFLGTGLIASFLQGTIDETVFGIHDGGLGVATCLFLHTGCSNIASLQQLLAILWTIFLGQMTSHILKHFTIVLQKFDGQISGGIAQADMLVGFQVFLDMLYALLYLMSIVDVDMTGGFLLLVGLNDGTEEFLDTHATLERRGNHGHTEE